MVRAILEGRKTVTRRVLKPQLPQWGRIQNYEEQFMWRDLNETSYFTCPYGWIGDRLWVREKFGLIDFECIDEDLSATVRYPADESNGMRVHGLDSVEESMGWRSPMFMPRIFSRITLEITNVKLEFLDSITNEGAIAEGCESRRDFAELWDELHKDGFGWVANPRVWVISFSKVRDVYGG
jgi:hypothetical protein